MFGRDGEEEEYEEAETVEYPLKLFSKQPREQVKGKKGNSHEEESE